jgi:hypothetical protein
MKNNYETFGNTTTIFIKYKDKVHKMLIDTEDLKLIDFYPWSIEVVPMKSGFYARFKNKKPLIIIHRLIMKANKGEIVDHINHSTLDNRKSNLRIVNYSGNQQNLIKIKNKTGVRNIEVANGKYRIALTLKGKKVRFGSYTDLNEAKSMVEKLRAKFYPYSQEALKSKGA